MRSRFNFRSEFLRSVVVVASGAVLAQLINFALAPIITRLYTPEELGEFNFFLRIITFISILATARYELSLPLPGNDRDSFHLYRLALRIASYTTLVVILFAFGFILFKHFDQDAIYLGISVIIGSFLLVFNNLGTNWSIRVKAFNTISYSKVTAALSTNGLRVIMGVFSPGTYALIFTYLIGIALSSIQFLRVFVENNKRLQPISKKRMMVLSRIYSEFPKVSLPHAIMEAGRDVIVAMFVMELFSKFVFGSYDHSMRMLRLPLLLIGASLSQVLFNRVSELRNTGQPMLPIVRKTLIYLFFFSIIPFGIVLIFGDSLFALVFGEDWRFSGYLSQIMAPWLMFNFLASPVSAIPIVLGKQRQFFIIGLVSSIFYLIGFGALPLIFPDWVQLPDRIFGFVSFTQSLITLYSIYFVVKIVRESDADLELK